MTSTRTWLGTGLMMTVLGVAACSATDATGVSAERLSTDDDGDYVSARATQGLAITPAALNLTGKTDDEVQTIGYGSYLVNAVGICSSCHGAAPGKFLAGGTAYVLDATHSVFARNLTPDPTTGMQLSEDQFVEALRTGKDFKTGATTRLAVMPWASFRWMSRGDIHAVYSYLRALPPVVNTVPADTKNGLGLPAQVDYTGVFEDGDVTRKVASDPGDPSPNSVRGLDITPFEIPSHLGSNRNEYGRGSYLVNMGTCNVCHNNQPSYSALKRFEGRDPYTQKLDTAYYLTGGHIFIPPPPVRTQLNQVRILSADLLGENGGFFHEDTATFDTFLKIIRTGTHADESPARKLGFPMPWANFKNMLDADLHAMYVYLSNAPARTGAGDKEVQDWARYCTSNAMCHTGETCYPNPANGFVGECVGATCSADIDCDACQTCTGGVCTAPTASSVCVKLGN